MGLSPATASDKALNDREATTDDKRLVEEDPASAITLAGSEVFGEAFDVDPVVELAKPSPKIQARTLDVLQEITSVDGQVAFRTGTAASPLRDWIPPKFGDDYTPRFFENNNTEIFAGDQINRTFRFNSKTGILTIEDVSGLALPPKITAYRYVGLTVQQVVDTVTAGAAAFEIATHADLATIPTGNLIVNRRWRVLTDGTEWAYTGVEAAAPDPTNVDAWELVAPARKGWFFPASANNTVTRYFDDVNGNDVFNDGSLAQPWQSGNRFLAQIPNEIGRGPGFLDTVRSTYIFEVGVPGAKLHVGRGLVCKFCRLADITIQIIGERTPIDLDGLGTTQFTGQGSVAKTLTGPNPNGGTIAKDSYGTWGTGITLLPAVQDPTEAANWVVSERDDGVPGKRAFSVRNHLKTHTVGELAADEIVTSSSFGGGTNPNFEICPIVTEVASSSSTANLSTPGGVLIRWLGFNFGGGGAVRLGNTTGNHLFQGCRIDTSTSGVTYRASGGDLSAFASSFDQSYVVGGSGSTNADRFTIIGDLQTFVNVSNTLFLNSVLCLVGEVETRALTFRGNTTPKGGNNVEGRLCIGFEFLDNANARICKFSRRDGLDFERSPGDAGPMVGDAIVVVGRGTTAGVGSSVGGVTRFDVDGAPFTIGFGARLIVPSSVGYEGGFGKPILMRDGAAIGAGVLNSSSPSDFGSVVNYVDAGRDIQLGSQTGLAADEQLFASFSDLPVSDFHLGASSERLNAR